MGAEGRVRRVERGERKLKRSDFRREIGKASDVATEAVGRVKAENRLEGLEKGVERVECAVVGKSGRTVDLEITRESNVLVGDAHGFDSVTVETGTEESS